jgi:hypothetical protein
MKVLIHRYGEAETVQMEMNGTISFWIGSEEKFVACNVIRR